jgi:transposase-like protein
VDTIDMLETGSMERRKRRKFTREYKAEVVQLVHAAAGKGKSLGQVAHELDLTETAVRAWVKRVAIDARKDPNGPLTTEERAELTRLRRELKTATMERDFLRKAAAFFAKSGR